MFLTANCSKTIGRFEVSGTAVFLPSAYTAKHKWKLLALVNYISSYVFRSIGRQKKIFPFEQNLVYTDGLCE